MSNFIVKLGSNLVSNQIKKFSLASLGLWFTTFIIHIEIIWNFDSWRVLLSSADVFGWLSNINVSHLKNLCKGFENLCKGFTERNQVWILIVLVVLMLIGTFTYRCIQGINGLNGLDDLYGLSALIVAIIIFLYPESGWSLFIPIALIIGLPNLIIALVSYGINKIIEIENKKPHLWHAVVKAIPHGCFYTCLTFIIVILWPEIRILSYVLSRIMRNL